MRQTSAVGTAKALDQDADLRRFALLIAHRAEAISRIVGNAGAHGRMLLRWDRTGGRPTGYMYGRRRTAGRQRSRKAPAAPTPGHRGGAVNELMGLTSAITSTSSRESFAKARQAATSISLS